MYGPWSARKRGAITTFFNRLHAGEPLVIYGDGSSLPGLHPRGRHLPRAAAGPGDWTLPGGTVLHIASGVETTAPRARRRCAGTRPGAPGHPVEYAADAGPGEVDRNFATYELAGKLLGYAPTISS